MNPNQRTNNELNNNNDSEIQLFESVQRFIKHSKMPESQKVIINILPSMIYNNPMKRIELKRALQNTLDQLHMELDPNFNNVDNTSDEIQDGEELLEQFGGMNSKKKKKNNTTITKKSKKKKTKKKKSKKKTKKKKTTKKKTKKSKK